MYLRAQIAAGAAAVQLFDTWVGELTLDQYREFALPATQLLIEEIGAGDTPVILYTKASSHLLAAAAESGANVLSVDWRVDLAAVRELVGPRIALQGNVDPCLLLGPEEGVRRAAREAVESTGGVGHILNLGHGILQQTPVENARAFVQAGQAAPGRTTRCAWKGRGKKPAMSDSSLHLQLNRERFEISEEFLEKYNRPGPRYTSYPTAPVWQDNFGPDDLEQFYATANAARTPVSLYMHLPFCESLCLFCACNVVITKDHSVAPPYIEILEREIEHVSRFVSRERPVVQFHWGGGTPTYLTPGTNGTVCSASRPSALRSRRTRKSASRSIRA